MIRRAETTDDRPSAIEIIEVTDPQELAEVRQRRAEFDLNSEWLRHHIPEIYAPANRGKIVCIAGQEAFFGDTAEDVVARAAAAHPDDHGWFTRYIPREKVARIYAS